MFDAPTKNPYNAKYYGTAAVSPTLLNAEDTNVEWRGSGCWKVTGTANIAGYSHATTLVLKGAILCPSENEEFAVMVNHTLISLPQDLMVTLSHIPVGLMKQLRLMVSRRVRAG
jgi:hypothetical protein